MRILVCGNRATHLWPEACATALGRMGHEVEVLYYLEPTERDLERFVPRRHHADVPLFLKNEASARELMRSLFLCLARDFQPELILLAGIYHTWPRETLDELRKHVDAPIVLWAGDNPYQRGATDIFRPSPHYARVYFTEYGGEVQAAPDLPCPTAFLSFGCDPERDVVPPYAPGERERLRSTVSYLGTLKNDRCDVLDALARAGVGLRVWSPPVGPALGRYPALAAARDEEQIQGERARALYGASDIVLNLHHTGFGNMKFYEVASCGAFQISNLRADVRRIEPAMPVALRVVAYEQHDELVDLVRHFTAHPEERITNAREIQRVVREEYTWERRLRTILDDTFPARAAAARVLADAQPLSATT
ncbi:MAG: glycosyltransferase [Planctomycetota bacterium]